MTQKTVVAKQAKARVRSIKDLGGASPKRSNPLGGFLKILQDTNKNRFITQFLGA
jgi:hypothetical protein